MDDVIIYRKIPKISLGAYIFQRPFLRGLYSEGLIYGRKFAFQNRLPLGWRYSWKEIYLFCFVLLCIWGQLPSTSPWWGGAYIWRGDLTKGFLHYEFGGLIHRGDYFWNFTVWHMTSLIVLKILVESNHREFVMIQNAQKRCCWHCNITPTNHIIA